MSGLWVIGEPGPDGGLAHLSEEVATLARAVGEASGREATGVMVGADPGAAAGELARYLPRVIAITEPAAADHAWAAVAAVRIAALAEASGADAPDLILVGAGPDGRDLAGALSALTGLGVLTGATSVAWNEAGPTVEMGAFGGKLLTTSTFTSGRGIVTVRPNVVTAEAAPSPGTVEQGRASAAGAPALPPVRVVERVSEAGAAAPIEEARIIVAGGRGVGGPEGFGLVEQLAEVLGGAVGATRAAVNSG